MTTFLQFLTLVLIGVTGAVSFAEQAPTLHTVGSCLALLMVGTLAIVLWGVQRTPQPEHLK